MDNNNKNVDLHFTELTQDDIQIQEDLYISLLMRDNGDIANIYFGVYCSYASLELQKAKRMFWKTFGHF